MKENKTASKCKKKIAVLMSTYNGEKHLKQQIDSILSQKCKCQIDLHIRDDGSNDKTIEIIKNYQTQHPNIFLDQAKNIGCNASFFELLRNVNGYDYYAFSDQDDVWMEDKLQVAVDLLEKDSSSAPLLYGSCSKLVDDDLKELGITQRQNKDITFFNTIIQNFLPGHSQVMNDELRRDLVASKVDTSRIYIYDSWITNVAMVRGKIIFDNNPHTYYRQHAKNELGYGGGKLNWYKERLKRVKNNQSGQYSKQIDYFIEKYHDDLEPELLVEMNNYQKSRQNFAKRLNYVTKCKLYRQKPVETGLFKIMYLMRLC